MDGIRVAEGKDSLSLSSVAALKYDGSASAFVSATNLLRAGRVHEREAKPGSECQPGRARAAAGEGHRSAPEPPRRARRAPVGKYIP